MGAEPLPAPERHAASGVSTSDPDDALNKDITLDELCSCIKRLKLGKSPGMDGVPLDMIKNGGEIVKQKLVTAFQLYAGLPFP